MLGHEESCVYLVEGHDTAMLINGGMSYLVEDILDQIQSFGIDESRIQYALILHAHFDHVGIIPFFKRRNPAMEVLASARGWEILGMEKAIRTINTFSRNVAEKMGRADVCERLDLDWRDDIKGTAVAEGDSLDLGGRKIQILETPGHSSCSITGYVPDLRALFGSDGVGIPYKDTIMASGNSNYTAYQKSLEKLRGLDVELVCADHYGTVMGDEARGFIDRSIETAAEHRKLIEATYLRTLDEETAARELVDMIYRENEDYFLSPEILEGVYRQMVSHIAGALADKGA